MLKKLILKTSLGLLLLLVATFIGVIIIHFINPIPLKALNDCSKVVYDKEQKPLYITINSSDSWQIETNLTKIDPLFLKMVINYEDKNFYKHFGVDFLALLRASYQYIKNKKVISGASTITMQLAKLLEPKPRDISAKIKEIFRAIELELFFTKDEILSNYLTLTPYGSNIKSITAASLYYFNKLPSSLTPSQSAMLIALPQAPNATNPLKHPKRAKLARDKILKRAYKANIISKSLYNSAIKSKISTTYYRFPRYAYHLSSKLVKKYKSITTTLDKKLQIQIENWAKLKGKELPKGVSLATLVVDNNSAEILAYLGSYNIFSKDIQGYVDMLQAIRSPGSTLKPLIYALGFSKKVIAPLTIINDQESIFANYKPNNFDKKFNGEVTISYALQHSLNIPAVKVLQRVGVVDFVSLLNSLDFRVKIPKKRASLAVALGGLGITAVELASYYQALANNAVAINIHYLKDAKTTKREFLNKKATKEVNAILQTILPPLGFIKKDVDIAYKTGTSYGFRDFWSVAYTKDYTVVLWVGRADGKPMLKSSGLKKAAPLAFEVMGIIDSIYKLKPWGYLAKNYLKQPPNILKYFDNKDKKPIKKFTFAYPNKEARYKSTNCKDVKIKAKVVNGIAPYVWYIDNLLQPFNNNKIYATLDSGAHTITTIDKNGNIITTTIWIDKPECKYKF